MRKRGVLLIGVNDSKEVKGIQLGKKSIEDISSRIQTASDPRIQPSISALTYQHKEILVIQVAHNMGVPVTAYEGVSLSV